ncbi:MAG: winged helix-turn-helix domain-containing protein [Shewanella sp.]
MTLPLSANCLLDFSKQQLIFANGTTIVELSFAETAILKYLIEHNGNLVTKDELLRQGWPGRMVASSSLLQSVSLLRKKLSSEPCVELKTIPRHGYVLHLMQIPPSANKHSQVQKNYLNRWIISGLLLAALGTGLLAQYHNDSDPLPWQQQTLPVTINGLVTNNHVYTVVNSKPLQVDKLQHAVELQITREHNWQPPFTHFEAYSVLDSQHHSLALCPDYSNGQCPGDALINISGDPLVGGKLSLSDFLATKIRMEQKTYNKLQLPELAEIEGDLVEDVYHGDLYFKVKDNLLVRSDFRISLINFSEHTGLLYFAACITDENCATSPIRFEMRGDFERTQRIWQGKPIDIFTLKTNRTELSSPNALSNTAKTLYLDLRKQHLTQTTRTFYRLYQDDGTAVWLVPFKNYYMVWMQKISLKL